MHVTFAHSVSGRSYFEKFLDELSIKDELTILDLFEEIQSKGLEARSCDFRQIEGKLWEIKMRTVNSGYRFFYTLISTDQMYVLHFYKKQGQKAPLKELSIARKRLKEILK